MTAPMSYTVEGQDGFFRLATLRATLGRQGRAALPDPDAPALRCVRDDTPPEALDDDGDLAYRRTLEGGATPPEGRAGSYLDRVAFLRKRPGNPFPHMITIGRARNSDLVASTSAVSKVHAYFLREGGAWFVVDQRSRNGTFVAGRRLGPGERARLEDGARIGLGEHLDFVFLSADGLVAALQGGRP